MNEAPKTLRIDDWSGTKCKHLEVDRVTTIEFDAWLNQLDAEKHTLLLLAPTGTDERVAHLAIGGGKGQYVVYVTEDNETFWSLLSLESPSDQVVMLMAGGQKGDYPARRIVGIEQARSAGHSYIVQGTRDTSQMWERS